MLGGSFGVHPINAAMTVMQISQTTTLPGINLDLPDIIHTPFWIAAI
jgi:hypothetical protein